MQALLLCFDGRALGCVVCIVYNKNIGFSAYLSFKQKQGNGSECMRACGISLRPYVTQLFAFRFGRKQSDENYKKTKQNQKI